MYKQLFRKKVNNFKVRLNNGKLVRYINLDNAATTPAFKSVEEAVDKYLISYGSVHRGSGYKSSYSTEQYENAREVIKDFVNAPADSYVLFTGNTTGGMNTAAYFFSQLKGKVMVSDIEHSSSWLSWIKEEGFKHLGNRQFSYDEVEQYNTEIQRLGLNEVLVYKSNKDFEFDLKDIEDKLKNNNIKVFVLTAASNLTGYCPNITKIGKLVHKYGAYFLVDACQFIQHHPIDMVNMGIDFLVASGHKFYAPYGGGFLIGPKQFFDKFLPYQIGGGNIPYITQDGYILNYKNQLTHDAGTPNAIGAISMAEALKTIKSIGINKTNAINKINAYERKLAEYVYNNFSRMEEIELYVKKEHLSNIIAFNIKGCNAKEIADILNNDYGIGVRAGSFCVYHVVRKLLNIQDDTEIVESVMNGDNSNVPGIIRVSFSLQNREDDARRLVNVVREIIANIKQQRLLKNNAIMDKNEEVWKKLLLDFPVAVNNFYGDPFIQWKNTYKRLSLLAEQKHTGPVGLITKSKMTDKWIADLVNLKKKGLNIVVLCSISELKDYELAPHDYRYENIKKLNDAGIPNIAYIRPMIPPYNTSPETIEHIISNLAKVKADAVCLSGFRGDDELVQDMNPDSKLEWTMRVKLLTKDVYERFKAGAEVNGMHLFLRTACAVAYVLNMDSPFNPYYNSPNLCKCSELNCPLLNTCKRPKQVKEGSLEFLKFLGFDVELQYLDENQLCYIEGDNRLGCLSCCTTCYNLKVPRLYVKNKDINLGTLTFIRFLTGMLAVQDNVRDFGDKDIGFVKFPNYPKINDFVCINTWASYAQHGDRCFDCTYCIEKYYKGRDCNTTPLDLFNRIRNLLNRGY